MSCRPGAVFLVLALALAGGSCGRRGSSPSRPPRIAILRFENLGASPSQDWVGRALAEVVETDLSHAHDWIVIRWARVHALEILLGARPVSDPGISTERQAALAAGAGRLAYGTYRIQDGRLRADLTIEDVLTRKIVLQVSSSGPAGDPIAVGASLAARISRQAIPFPTRSPEALRQYSEALESGDLPRTVGLLQQAIIADPYYGAAYRALAQVELQHQDRAGSITILEKALAQGPALGPAERARIAADLAGLQNQPELRQRALAALVRLEPNDDTAWQALAAVAMSRRDFLQAETADRRLLERQPEDLNDWNQLGYTAAYLGDLNTARDAVRHYATLRPTDLNPLDSLGDVNFMCGHFHEAEEAYLKAAAKDPNFRNNGELFKAAMARLWTGDIGGADALAGRYHQARAAAHDPLVEFRRDQWMWLSGRRKEACRRMETFARAALGDVAPRAWTELVIWNLMLGDRAAALAAADETARTAGANTPPAMVTRFLVQPPVSGAEWIERAAQAFPNPQQAPIRGAALTTALLLNRQFDTVAAQLQQTIAAGPPEPDATAPVLLAWSYLETGRAAAAAPLLKTNPAPSLNGADALLTLSFPRIYYLRAEEAARDGKRAEARANYRLFLTLSGPDPLTWGEEQKAKAALGGS